MGAGIGSAASSCLEKPTAIEGGHTNGGNGAAAITTLRTAALTLLLLARFHSFRAGMQALMRYVMALLAMARRPSETHLGLSSLLQDSLLDSCLVQAETVTT
jgi:hypothetical protein